MDFYNYRWSSGSSGWNYNISYNFSYNFGFSSSYYTPSYSSGGSYYISSGYTMDGGNGYSGINGNVGNNPVNATDSTESFVFVFNAGGHIWFPMTAGSAGFNFSSEWKPGGSIQDAVYKGRKSEYTIASIADIGVSAGIGGLSKYKGGQETTLSISTGKYGGVQLNYKDGNFDGLTVGLGLGLSLPVNFTMPFKDFISGYRNKYEK